MIEEAAMAEPQTQTPDNDVPLRGTVFRVNSGNYYVLTGHGEFVCRLRGNLKKELVYSTSGSRPRRVQDARKRRTTDPIAVGDHVMIDTHLGMIEEILPRHSSLSRESPSARGQHTLVANLDCLYVVVAARHPWPDLSLLDKFLVIAEAAEIEAGVVVNKMDLLAGDEDETRAAMAVYERIGYKVLYLSAKHSEGVDELRAALAGKISAFAGASGVGKSSLLNALEPGLSLRTGAVSAVTFQGRHTTTSAELFPLPGAQETWLADTPGLRQVDFWEVDKDDMQFCFPEFAPHLGECKFANCRHHTELGCAVRAAVDAGTIDTRRYQSYLQTTEQE